MGKIIRSRGLIAVLATALAAACGAAHAQSSLRDNPGLAFRAMVVRVLSKTLGGEDGPAGFGIVIGEREGQVYIATPDHVVRDRVPGGFTDRPDVVFFIERPDRRAADLLPQRLDPEHGDLAVLSLPPPPDFAAAAAPVVPVAELAWGEEVWNVGRNGEWIVPTSPGGYQDQQPRTGLLVFDRVAAPPGASGSAVVAEAGLVGMLVIDSGRGDVAYALPAETIERQFREWGLPVGFSTPPAASSSERRRQEESEAVLRARYERARKICDQVADPRDASRPVDVPGTMVGARVIIGAPPPMEPIIEGCRLAVEGFPQMPRYRYQLGTALYIAGRNGEAIDAWRAASEQGHASATTTLHSISNR